MLNDQLLTSLEKTLSKERLEYWSTMANKDRERGLLLHRRNTLVASVLFADLQVLEIALRNALDRELQKRYPPDWLNNSLFSNRNDVQQAKKRAQEIHDVDATRHDKVLVCLQFSFWVSILNWQWMRRAMGNAFRAGTKVDEIHAGLKQLLALRNAMAHHEPILDGTRPGKSLKADLEVLDKVLKAICPTTAEWLHSNSWIRPLIEAQLVSCSGTQSHEVPMHVP